MTSTAVKKRPFVKGLNLSFGLLSLSGDVLPPKRSGIAKEESFKMVCPHHPDTPHLVSQRYVCAEGLEPEPVLPSDCLKGREVDDAIILVDKDAVKEVRLATVPEKTLDLAAHPYDPTTTFASGNAYVFQPDAANQFYSALLLLVDEQGVVETESGPKMLVGLVAFRKNSETFVRLERWGKQLVLRELVRPEDVDTFEPLDGTVDTKVVDMARQLVDAQSDEFDPETYKASVRDRIASLTEQAAGGEVAVKALAAAPKVDTMALLEASLAAAKAKKG